METISIGVIRRDWANIPFDPESDKEMGSKPFQSRAI